MLPIIGFYSGDREHFSQLFFYRQHFLLPAFLSAYIDHTAVGGIPRLCNITHTVQITQYLGDAGARDIQHFADIADADGSSACFWSLSYNGLFLSIKYLIENLLHSDSLAYKRIQYLLLPFVKNTVLLFIREAFPGGAFYCGHTAFPLKKSNTR